MGQDTGKLILRLALAILILLHGIAKITKGVDPIGGMLTAHGLPDALKYGAFVGEVVAPLLLIVGYWSRIGGWLIAVNMLFAIWLVHWGDVSAIDPQSGALVNEKQYMYLLAAIAIALIGPGRFAVNDR